MGNLLGLSAESWGFLVVALGLLCGIPLGLAVQKRWLRLGAASAVGFEGVGS